MLADDLSNKLGFKRIIVEGDSMEIVGHFVDETKSLLNQLESWNVQHVVREANVASSSDLYLW